MVGGIPTVSVSPFSCCMVGGIPTVLLYPAMFLYSIGMYLPGYCMVERYLPGYWRLVPSYWMIPTFLLDGREPTVFLYGREVPTRLLDGRECTYQVTAG